jgi:hypothetical protein
MKNTRKNGRSAEQVANFVKNRRSTSCIAQSENNIIKSY